MTDLAPAAISRRRAFAAFLRSRRERLSPSDVGLPAGFRRRTPGLRREEVALLAGVGTTWYTWLEQGRDVQPSAAVLAAIADALCLDQAERNHLFTLAGRPQPSHRSVIDEQISETLARLLASLSNQPAYVIGRRWDILMWNEAATAVFGDPGETDAVNRNIMHRVFADAEHRAALLDWEGLARGVLAQFRLDSARHLGDPAFDELIDELHAISPEFREWWPKHEVDERLSGNKTVRHPQAGLLTFEFMTLAIDDGSDMKLIVYTPLAENDSIRKVDALLKAVSATAG